MLGIVGVGTWSTFCHGSELGGGSLAKDDCACGSKHTHRGRVGGCVSVVRVKPGIVASRHIYKEERWWEWSADSWQLTDNFVPYNHMEKGSLSTLAGRRKHMHAWMSTLS